MRVGAAREAAQARTGYQHSSQQVGFHVSKVLVVLQKGIHVTMSHGLTMSTTQSGCASMRYDFQGRNSRLSFGSGADPAVYVAFVCLRAWSIMNLSEAAYSENWGGL